ncbi:pilus assembly protein PilM [bacterium]|nr:pilus assembly protein PilM [bacterium]
MRRSLLYKLFPVPKYLEMPAVGMDISEVSLRFVELVPKGRGLVLGKHGERGIPPGTIAEGGIKDMAVFQDVLRKVRKDFGIGFVHASLSEAHAYLADIEIPAVPLKDLRGSLELQLDQYVPLAPNDLFFDYTILGGEKNGQKSEHIKLGVSVVARDPVLKYIEAFSGAGLTLLSVEVDADALVRAILPPEAVETIMIIEMGRVKTGIYVVTNRMVRFASELDFGAKMVGAMLQKKFPVSIGELSEVLAACYGESAPPPEAVEVLQEFFEQIREQIEKHYMYWNSHHARGGTPSDEKIERIILAGSQSALYGFDEYLSSRLHEPLAIANPWANLSSFRSYIPEISRNDSLRYATAIGLALHPYEQFLKQ